MGDRTISSQPEYRIAASFCHFDVAASEPYQPPFAVGEFRNLRLARTAGLQAALGSLRTFKLWSLLTAYERFYPRAHDWTCDFRLADWA